MRPLTLLNSQYKIIAKIFDNRLRTVLPCLISEDQTGFLSRHTISTNIKKSLDFIEYTSRGNVPALIMSIDIEKCFDKIDYSAALGALEYFNFGPFFMTGISLFFNQFQVCTQNFGHLSSFFVKSRSVNQGV